LYGQLEALDPSYDCRKWEELDGTEQDVYLLGIERVIRFESRAVMLVLANDGCVDGRPKVSKDTNPLND
jgi:hypothetical protein